MLLFFTAAFMILLMILPVCVKFSLASEENGLDLHIGIKLPLLKTFTVYKTRITAASVKKSLTKKRKVRWRIVPLLKRLRGHVRHLSVVLRFGTGNAASTACLAGQLYGIFAPLTAGKPERNVLIQPVFEEKTFFAQGKCMIRTSAVHAIISMIASAKIQKSVKNQTRFSRRKT